VRQPRQPRRGGEQRPRVVARRPERQREPPQAGLGGERFGQRSQRRLAGAAGQADRQGLEAPRERPQRGRHRVDAGGVDLPSVELAQPPKPRRSGGEGRVRAARGVARAAQPRGAAVDGVAAGAADEAEGPLFVRRQGGVHRVRRRACAQWGAGRH
jgi:hypothetical protein